MYKSIYESPVGMDEQESAAWAVGWNDCDSENATIIFNLEMLKIQFEDVAKLLYEVLIDIEEVYNPETGKMIKIWDRSRLAISVYEEIINR